MIIFSIVQKIQILGIHGPPYCGIGATIRIGQEMLCVPYAGFFSSFFPPFTKVTTKSYQGYYWTPKIA